MKMYDKFNEEYLRLYKELENNNFEVKNEVFKLEKNIALFKYNELRFSVAYAYEEYTAGNFRNRYTLEILFKHKF